ncbi:hypothetical protein [Companilactobacillus kedongensis]|uniref:hypothetical protein n=1 Tax=Companilactobacillus kedongensis TaxID=2486004 RepID=UPI000F78B4B4|nr:hypothetical protein [Companilactobacillus kedongensis]
MITIGRYLKTKRFFSELTLLQVTHIAKDKYGYSTSTSVLSAIETDKNKIIDGELLFVLSDIYDFDLNEFKEVVIGNISNIRERRKINK